MNAETMMFSLLRAEICGERETEDIARALSADVAEALFKESKRHDLAHIIGHGLEKRGVLAQLPNAQQFKKQMQLAIYRNAKMSYVYQQICQLFEEDKIAFLPLKGTVIRRYYPEAWMRTSSDIDILVKKEDLGRAVRCLEEAGYINKGRAIYDVSFFSPTGVHVELHFELITDYEKNNNGRFVRDLWENAILAEGTSFCYELPDGLFYFYHMVHMAKHFKEGGCGVRTVLDTWLLNHRVAFDAENRKHLLTRGGLQTFAEKMEQLADVWFSGNKADTVLEQIAEVILKNGLYGTYEQRIAMRQAKKAGNLQYWLSRIFLPYQQIKYHYPVLQKHKWLLPVFEIVRLVELVFNGGLKRSRRELKVYNQVSSAESAHILSLFQILEL